MQRLIHRIIVLKRTMQRPTHAIIAMQNLFELTIHMLIIASVLHFCARPDASLTRWPMRHYIPACHHPSLSLQLVVLCCKMFSISEQSQLPLDLANADRPRLGDLAYFISTERSIRQYRTIGARAMFVRLIGPCGTHCGAHAPCGAGGASKAATPQGAYGSPGPTGAIGSINVGSAKGWRTNGLELREQGATHNPAYKKSIRTFYKYIKICFPIVSFGFSMFVY